MLTNDNILKRFTFNNFKIVNFLKINVKFEKCCAYQCCRAGRFWSGSGSKFSYRPDSDPVPYIPILYAVKGTFSRKDLWDYPFKGVFAWEFDGIFMILSYSLDVRQLPLVILFFNLMFSYLNFIFFLISVSRLTKIQYGYSVGKNEPFIPNVPCGWDKFCN
jgi:hypothetical protein